MTKIIDQQGFEVKEGKAYQFIFAMPGPDVTLLKIKKVISEDEIIAHDLIFGFDIAVKANSLFRPVKRGWSEWDLKILIQHEADIEIEAGERF